MNKSTGVFCLLSTSLVFAAPVSVQAQTLTLDESPVPLNYSRDRNVSVVERPRPELDPAGVAVGGFVLRPRLDAAFRATDNAFQNDALKKSATYFVAAPSLTLASNWNVHSLALNADGLFKRYNKYSLRNEDGWNVGAKGRLDVDSSLKLFANLTTGRYYDSGFTGGNIAVLGEPIPFQHNAASGRVEYSSGRVRLIGAVDYSDFNYKDSKTFSGLTLDSDRRDRKVARGTAQAEYGFTPDASAFIQYSYTDVNYDLPLLGVGVPNRDSGVNRILGGVSFDVSALIRGTVGVGYTSRKFDASTFYRKSKGVSFEGQIEYFPSPLTTVSLSGKRILRESFVPNSTDFFETTFAGRVDHELLRNVLLRASVSHSKENYRGVVSSAKVTRLGAGVRYMLTRSVALDGDFSHGKRSVSGIVNGSEFKENVGGLSLTLQM